ncbi:hypothetical protein MOP89_14575 [Enterococcus gallinarum]|nr:hypothetical protein [Enterococcus gallinarum]
MLEDLIDGSIIQLNKPANDWVEAVNISMKPLVEQGIVTQGYVQGVIDNAVNHSYIHSSHQTCGSGTR